MSCKKCQHWYKQAGRGKHNQYTYFVAVYDKPEGIRDDLDSPYPYNPCPYWCTTSRFHCKKYKSFPQNRIITLVVPSTRRDKLFKLLLRLKHPRTPVACRYCSRYSLDPVQKGNMWICGSKGKVGPDMWCRDFKLRKYPKDNTTEVVFHVLADGTTIEEILTGE